MNVSDLAEFLTARLDEDEAIARRTNAASMEWRDFTMDYELRDSYNAGTIATSLIEENREHIARHDPARVLREVEAKRRIIRTVEAGKRWRVLRTNRQMKAYREWAEHVLRLLALPYADRPGYRSEWAP